MKKLFDGDGPDDKDDLLLQMITANDHTTDADSFYRGLDIIRGRMAVKARRKRRRSMFVALFAATLFGIFFLRGDNQPGKTVAFQDALFQDVALIFLTKFDTRIFATTVPLYDCRFSVYFHASDGVEALDVFCKAFDLAYHKDSAGSYYLRGTCAGWASQEWNGGIGSRVGNPSSRRRMPAYSFLSSVP